MTRPDASETWTRVAVCLFDFFPVISKRGYHKNYQNFCIPVFEIFRETKAKSGLKNFGTFPISKILSTFNKVSRGELILIQKFCWQNLVTLVVCGRYWSNKLKSQSCLANPREQIEREFASKDLVGWLTKGFRICQGFIQCKRFHYLGSSYGFNITNTKSNLVVDLQAGRHCYKHDKFWFRIHSTSVQFQVRTSEGLSFNVIWLEFINTQSLFQKVRYYIFKKKIKILLLYVLLKDTRIKYANERSFRIFHWVLFFSHRVGVELLLSTIELPFCFLFILR